MFFKPLTLFVRRHTFTNSQRHKSLHQEFCSQNQTLTVKRGVELLLQLY